VSILALKKRNKQMTCYWGTFWYLSCWTLNNSYTI